jgi:hypothetical protein
MGFGVLSERKTIFTSLVNFRSVVSGGALLVVLFLDQIMNRLLRLTCLGTLSAVICRMPVALADGVAGDRVFPITLTFDDPNVDDQIRMPTVSWLGTSATGTAAAGGQYTFSGGFEKTITENLGIFLSNGYAIQAMQNAKTASGWQDLVGGIKYKLFVDAPHEFMLAVGVQREFGGTGADQIGADIHGNTTPTVYFAKGFGDVPVDVLRPFAVSGTLGYAIADVELKGIQPAAGTDAQQFNNGYANRWNAGLSIQYSLPYLQEHVKDVSLEGFVGDLVPIVEMTYSAPASSPNNLGTQFLVAPGVIYMGEGFQGGLEALIPTTKATGRNVGFTLQFNVYLEDLFPHSLGKPLIDF